MRKMRWSNPLAFGKDLWDPSHRYETSWLLPPYVLFAIRFLFGLYALVVNLTQIGYYCTHQAAFGGCTAAGNTFSYFTTLTYWGLAFYFLVASVHTFTYARTGTPLLDRWPRYLQALHAFYYSTITVYPFIVTAVYWWRLYSGAWFTQEFAAFTNLSQHAMNSGFAAFEILVPRTPLAPWIHMWWLVFVLALYLALAYLTHATKGFYTYDFLDIQENGSGLVAAYIIGIAVACLVVYGIVKAVMLLRLWLTEKVLGKDGKFAHQPGYGNEDVEMAGFDRNRHKDSHSPVF